jgi:RimJ/RimL family protein N-acetyltransferase/ADP-ribose pyrophosphatase YjhB (NUDIX family)
MQILTERLRLRPLETEDVDALVAMDSDPEVRRYVDQPEAPSREEMLGRMPRLLRRYAGGAEPAFWAAEIRETGAFCGWFHLRPLDDDPGTLDVGYRLRREWWGRGLATEGARALVQRAFAELDAGQVVAHALEENIASRRVLEKLGLRERGRYLHRGALPAVAFALARPDLSLLAEFPFRSNGQDWTLSWHPSARAPEGTSHGAAGICLTPADDVVLVSPEGFRWDFPAGRAEDGESWEDTLRREVREEACARVMRARLLGFSRGRCVQGVQVGEVLVRSFWIAEVVLDPWKPRFEIQQRRLVPRGELISRLEAEGEHLPMEIYRQVLGIAGRV